MPDLLQPDISFRTFIRAIWNDPRQVNLRRHVMQNQSAKAWLEQDGPLPRVNDTLTATARSTRKERRVRLSRQRSRIVIIED